MGTHGSGLFVHSPMESIEHSTVQGVPYILLLHVFFSYHVMHQILPGVTGSHVHATIPALQYSRKYMTTMYTEFVRACARYGVMCVAGVPE